MASADDLKQIVTDRRLALISRWQKDPLQIVQVEGPAALHSLVYLDEDEQADVDQLGRKSERNVVLVQPPGGDKNDSCVWVRAGYGSYRGAYQSFLKSVYGLTASKDDLVPWDIDHLLNRARSPSKNVFIRIEAVPSSVNRSWGGLFEKVASNPAFFANQKRTRRTMSWVICAKLGGQPAPRGPGDTAGISRLAQFFVGIGLSRTEATEGLNDMLRFAYRMPA